MDQFHSDLTCALVELREELRALRETRAHDCVTRTDLALTEERLLNAVRGISAADQKTLDSVLARTLKTTRALERLDSHH